jgi:hypothetical protein
VARNARDPRQVAAATRRERDQLQRQSGDLAHVMSDVRGRRFLWDTLGRTGLYTTSFTGNSETFFREGRRSFGLELLARLTAVAPDLYLTMQAEAMAEDAKHAAADAAIEGEERTDG